MTSYYSVIIANFPITKEYNMDIVMSIKHIKWEQFKLKGDLSTV